MSESTSQQHDHIPPPQGLQKCNVHCIWWYFTAKGHPIPKGGQFHPPLNIPDAEEDGNRPLYDAAIEYLDRHMSRPEFTFRHRWREGDLVFWDNRFTLHYPINDFTGHKRLLLRCTALDA